MSSTLGEPVDTSKLQYFLSTTTFEAIIWLFFSLALISTIFRVVVLYLIRRKQHTPEHYLAIFATVLLLSCTILSELATLSGRAFVDSIRDHNSKKTPIDHTKQDFFEKVVAGYFVLAPTCLWTCKFSILFFTRILITPVKKHHFLFWSIFALLLSSYIVAVVIMFKPHYTPRSYSGVRAKKISIKRVKTAFKVAISLDVISDALPMIIPLLILPKLQISLRRKLSTIVMFVLGFIVIAFSITRLVESLKDLPSANSGNKFFLFTQLEGSIAVIVCNLPIVRMFHKYMTRQHQRGKQQSESGSGSGLHSNPRVLSSTGINVTKSTRMSISGRPRPSYQPFSHHQSKSQEILLNELGESETDTVKEVFPWERQNHPSA